LLNVSMTETQMAGELDGIQVWDGLDALGPARLCWNGDRIIAVEPLETARWPDLCAIPGFIDTHVHLVGSAEGQRADFATWPLTTTREEQVLHGAAHAIRAMNAGVTTLRDLAGDAAQIAIGRAFGRGILTGPRVLVHCVVGMTAGHNDLFTPAAVAVRPPTADGPDECRRLVRTWARAGADGIKIATSGGVLSAGDKSSWRNYTPPELAAVIDEAHALGMPVAAHAHSAAGIQAALDAGADSIEHATEISQEQAEIIAKQEIPVAPTLLINEAIAEARLPVGEEARDKAALLVERRDERFRYAAASGVSFVLGTDANGFHVDFGDQMRELRRMHEVLGYDAGQCLRAGTSAAATAIGLGGRVGRLAEGYGADVVIMRGRPWLEAADIATANIVAVISRGKLVAGTLPGD
jgi:imidazolonepropionase-like amidohydrolase